MRRATQSDVPWIKAFLTERIESSMFPLANLEDHGLDGSHERAVSAWIAPNKRGVFCVTRNGMMQPQLPDPRDWGAVAQIVTGREIVGCTGFSEQARAILAICGLDRVTMEVNRDEPLMRLSLAEIEAEPRGALMPFAELPHDIALDWRATYFHEVLGVPEARARERAADDMPDFTAQNHHRCLVIDGAPVAMTGFNARVASAVQLGGVFTPKEHRGKGYAGIAIRHHLFEAHQEGAETAILFAASDAAQAAYRRVGFEQIGLYSLCLFEKPERAL